jgi:hypothetical protein
MAKSARQTVFEGMELLPEALIPFVEKRLEATVQGHWQVAVVEQVSGLRPNSKGEISWDQASLLKAMMAFWKTSFGNVLGPIERSIVSELLEVRNRLSHNEPFSYDDAERALDSMRRLMEAISAGEVAAKLGRMRDTILRTKYRELARNEERRSQNPTIQTETMAGLLPWREVVEPHPDVATGNFQQAEFAADLAKVHRGTAPSEYTDPREFYARTYLTEGLSNLLVGAAKRLAGKGGDPVVELQTNFGGGKTHSMLALYHMVGGTPVPDLPGLDQLLREHGLDVPGKVNRAVLVGTSTGPSDVKQREKDYGRPINTTWGELAFQLGGEEAFQMVAEHDAKGIAPGSHLLEELFRKCAPCLILIDEWVAYLRQIYKVDSLPSGSFDANLSFVQALTEAVKASPQTLLVASLPASQIEVGGEGGQEALARLKQTFSRVESSWRPASQEESYEIVRRRLFKEISGDKYMHRDNVLKQFAKLYRENPNDFPQGCADEDYRRKLEKAYPIHPDLFDHLYTSWGALEKFQRTRGVLRLMAQVIHELWMAGDPSVMIMPGSVAVSSPRVEPELLHYLPNAWQGIIAGDVDGANSTPFKIDQANPNLNRYSATRRVARAIFMATAPSEGQQNRGIDDKRINLGVVQPGERVASFGDALRRLTNQAKFLHSDSGRYWYSMTPSLNRVAADRAAQFEEALILDELDKALKTYINGLKDRGDFDAVQVAPGDSSEVPDEPGGVRIVVLGVTYPHHNGRENSEAMTEARNILQQRGSTPRVYRNTLVFLAPDEKQLDHLKQAMRASLAWAEIVRDAESGRLDLMVSDIALARDKLKEAQSTLQTRLQETWCYLIYPYQETPQADVSFTSARIPTQDGVLSRASRKLVNDEALFPEIGPVRLNSVLEKYIWNDKPHLSLGDLWEYLNRYIYLPRLKNRDTLARSVRAAVSGLVPGPFAYAEAWDEKAQSYRGLVLDHGDKAVVSLGGDSVIVRSDIAARFKKESEQPAQAEATGTGGATATGGVAQGPMPSPGGSETPDEARLPTRFTATAFLSPDRPARDMSNIIEGIIDQLTTIPGAEVTIRVEIDAEVPSGLDRNKVRTLTENANTLKMEKQIR